MYFLIDYENVNNSGMEGVKFLNESDHVYLFYSQNSSPNMKKRYSELLYASKCSVEIIKLYRKGKNGLDFYIATKLGELLGQGENGLFSIISQDKGFQAVVDYWLHVSPIRREIRLADNIENAILKGGGGSERIRIIKEETSSIALETAYAVHEKEIELEEKMTTLLAEAGIEEAIRKKPLHDFLEKEESGKVLYLGLLKSYGRENGLKLYRAAKKVC